MTVLFWIVVGILAYTYAGYPLLLLLLSRVRNRPVKKARITPKVSLIIAAYNEEQVIRDRLENALRLDYPRRRLEIIVASDGSTDRTEEIVQSYERLGVRLMRFPRLGKIQCLQEAVAQSTGEILIFSDADTMASSNALRNLVSNFADPTVGAVAANFRHTAEKRRESSAVGEGIFSKYDSLLLRLESMVGSSVSAPGPLYAIRRELYPGVAVGGVTDDFFISTTAVQKGYRLVFEGEARASANAAARSKAEFSRRVRLITRGFRSLLLKKELFNPFRFGFYAVQLFSHKLLRRIAPVFLLILFVTSLFLAPVGLIYAVPALLQTCFYGLAALGLLLRRSRIGERKLLIVPFFYCLGNAAALTALIRVLRGQKIELWNPQREGQTQH